MASAFQTPIQQPATRFSNCADMFRSCAKGAFEQLTNVGKALRFESHAFPIVPSVPAQHARVRLIAFRT